MNLTPEEKIANEIWSLLNEIKSYILRLDKTENIEFDISTFLHAWQTNTHPFANSADVESILQKFESYGILVNLKKAENSLRYTFTVNIPVFDAVYKDYKFSFSNTFFKNPLLVTQDAYSQSGYLPEENKLTNQLLEYISRAIGDIAAGPRLVKFLKDMGVPEELIEYPQTKWKMINQVLTTLYFSDDLKKRNQVFTVIEGSCNPMMHNAEIEVAKAFESKLNKYLMLGGYQLKYFKLTTINRYSAYDNPKLRIYQNGPLILNLTKARLSLGNKSADISPLKQEIVFLRLLMENLEKLVEYKAIAKEANLNVYHDGIGNTDIELKKAVNFMRRDLRVYLTDKLKDESCVSVIMQSIQNETNVGYKMNPIQQKLNKKS